jgi:hypothetical protein
MVFASDETWLRVAVGDGCEVDHRVRLLRLWATGASCLYAGYLHPGTACVVSLMAFDGEEVLMNGVVARCAHAQRTHHELGLRFACPVDADDFARHPGGRSIRDERAEAFVEIAALAAEVRSLALDARDPARIAQAARRIAALAEAPAGTGPEASVAPAPGAGAIRA